MKNLIAATLIVLAGGASAGTASVDGNVITLNGMVDLWMATQFENKLTDEVEVVRLASPGGYVEHGDTIAKIIHEKGLTTEAIGDCKSMCAVIWLAGDNHVYNPEGSIGFHTPYVPGMDWWERTLFLEGMNGIQTYTKLMVMDSVIRYAEYINHPEHLLEFLTEHREHGTNPNDMWMLTVEQQLRYDGPFIEFIHVPAAPLTPQEVDEQTEKDVAEWGP